MKIIALLPIKNEEFTLRICLESLKPIVDEIIIFDDNSSDNSKEIANNFGCNLLSYNFGNEKFVDMSSRRQLLLEEGRRHGGTHFIWLDGDEAFSANFLEFARKRILALKPGQKMMLSWIALWKTCNRYVIGKSIYAGLFKDFVVCDAPNLSFEKRFLSENRTPGPTDNVIKISIDEGVVLHFQFVAWHKNQLKQAWYRCSELIEGSRSAKRINNTYSVTLENNKIKTETVPLEWIKGLSLPKGLESAGSGWRLEAIFNFFDKYGIEFFEPLQIWHVVELSDEFIKRTGRKPKSEVFPIWLVKLNDLKNKFKNYFSV